MASSSSRMNALALAHRDLVSARGRLLEIEWGVTGTRPTVDKLASTADGISRALLAEHGLDVGTIEQIDEEGWREYIG